MKYCTKCKKGIFNDGQFCPYCGGALIDYDKANDNSHIKTCKKCNKDFPPQYKKCAFCGGDLIDKNTFWDKEETVGYIETEKTSIRFIVEKTVKNGKGFIVIGKQFFNKSTNSFQYTKSTAIPLSAVKTLISLLEKAK